MSLVDHPFFIAWTQGELPLDALRNYACQYYHYEAAFPRYLSAIHARTESPRVRQHLLDNLWDEEHGERNHLVLWLEFAAAIGLDPGDVARSQPNAETQALVDYCYRVCNEAPIGEALAALYAYEGQVPRLAWEQMKGLAGHYGLEPAQIEFFSVHLVADVAHAGAELAAIEEMAGGDVPGVLAATETACDYLLKFLDGCRPAEVH
jgi:pyrroloquinoline-quinone synthase